MPPKTASSVVSVPSSSRSEAAKRGAQTRREAKEEEEEVEGLVKAGKALLKSTTGKCCLAVAKLLHEKGDLCFKVKAMLEDDTLETMLNPEEPEAESGSKEAPRKRLRNRCFKASQLPDYGLRAIAEACFPLLLSQLDEEDCPHYLADVVNYALHLTPSSELPTKTDPEAFYLDRFCVYAKKRYDDHGKVLDHGLPESLDYYKVNEESQKIELHLPGVKIDLPFAFIGGRIPEDAKIGVKSAKDGSFEPTLKVAGAKFISSKNFMEVSLQDVLATADPVVVEPVKWFLNSETGPWAKPVDLDGEIDGNNEDSLPDAVSEAGQTSVSTASQASKRRRAGEVMSKGEKKTVLKEAIFQGLAGDGRAKKARKPGQ